MSAETLPETKAQPATPDRLLTVSFGGGNNLAAITETKQVSWPEFAEMLTKEPPETEDKASVGWYAAAAFQPVYRHGDNLVARHALTLDYDAITQNDGKTIRAAYNGLAHALYTTWSHTKEKPRIRVVLPLSRPANADEFCAVSRHVAALAGIELAARESHVPAQCMFMPARKPGATFVGIVHPGKCVDVDAVLASYADWTDRKSWPHRVDGDTAHHGSGKGTAPTDKVGVVGDFCRAFDILGAIEKFDLPYDRTANPDRLTYRHGSRAEGVVLYDGGQKAQIHHDTSAARGQVNSFDLVRMHRYRELDTGLGDEVAVTDRPSFKAMVALALQLPEIRTAQAAEELEDLGPSPPPREVLSSASGRFRVIESADFAGAEFIEPDWQVDERVPARGIGLEWGKSGVFKSFAVYDLAACIHRGVPWRDRAVQKGRSVIVVAEGEHFYPLRIKAFAQHHNCKVSELPAIVPCPVNLFEPEQVGELIVELKKRGATYVVFDTLSQCSTGAEENSAKDLNIVIGALKRVSREVGCFAVAVHHSGKEASKGPRGSSVLTPAVDAEVFHESDGKRGVSTIEKLKDGPDGAKFSIEMVPVVLGISKKTGKEFGSLVVKHVEASPARRSEANKSKVMLDRFVMWWHREGRKPFSRGAVIRSNRQLKQVWPTGVTGPEAESFFDAQVKDDTIVPTGDMLHGAKAYTISDEVAERILKDVADWEAEEADAASVH